MTRLPLIALLAALSLTATAASAPTRAAGPAVAALRICGNDPFPSRVSDYGYVILNAWDWRRIAAIKAQSPNTKVLVYKDLSSTRDDAVHHGRDQEFLQSGVGYADASRHHPRWFLKDRRGARVSWASWPHAWQMDVGSGAYEQAWARHVLRELRARHWDGVFADGATAHPQAPWALGGRVFVRYPTDAAYQRAMTRLLRRVTPVIRRRRLIFVSNINDAEFPLWRRWLRFLSGTSREWWTKSQTGRGAGLLGGSDWNGQLRLLRTAEALNKVFIAITYGPGGDDRSIDYARASFLIAATSPTSAMTYSSGCGTTAWSPKAADRLGAPRGPAVQVGPAWRREFADGAVVVNPSPSPAPVQLGGLFRAPNGSIVGSLVVPPLTGFLLRRA